VIASIMLALALLCGCPIPVPSDTVTRPAIDFLVHDAAGTPIPNARVVLLTASDPHGRVEGIEEITTDAEGRASFSERVETLTQYPLMMHGVAFYFWWWCIETPHPTAITSAVTGRPAAQVDVEITPDAEGRRCVPRDDRLSAERYAPSTGLRARYIHHANADPLELAASSIRDMLAHNIDRLPKTFAFDVRVEGEHIVVDLGGLGAHQQQEMVDSITRYSRAELVDSAPFAPSK
jgi:5-hydroxyisourate hydrolase-like protein (transthyretin family)